MDDSNVVLSAINRLMYMDGHSTLNILDLRVSSHSNPHQCIRYVSHRMSDWQKICKWRQKTGQGNSTNITTKVPPNTSLPLKKYTRTPVTTCPRSCSAIEMLAWVQNNEICWIDELKIRLCDWKMQNVQWERNIRHTKPALIISLRREKK
jgi:hypothetical protein